ncbi:hypothetical protein LSH36_1538g00001 [Paralvinella palmiformis]|uniref:Uncharacterized protein n=1 Tax=Paralvinella palmiformis TaxID=53620 RepID=A0AAD9IS43_9ANNE|nr:hypothetical protein LSH36_1538g00001 [Paralvinella palmiformis]
MSMIPSVTIVQRTIQYQAAEPKSSKQSDFARSLVYQQYNGWLSMVLGIINILLVTLAIILNGVGFMRQNGRENDFLGNVSFIMFPAAFCGFFIYLAAALAIVSSIKKTRCIIISHLVLTIIGIIFTVIFIGYSAGAIDYEVLDSNMDKVSFGISIVWIILGIIMFITVTWCSALCCKVVCCGRSSH